MIEILDQVILDWFQMIQGPLLTPLMKVVTTLGEGGVIWILFGLLLLIRKSTRKEGAVVLLALIFCLFTGNILLKNIIARPRPCWRNPEVEMLIAIPKDYSFPSGHTMSSFAAATGIFLWNKKWGMAALVLAVLTSLSRLYFYVHYPTDVLAGMLIGIALAFIAREIVNRGVQRKQQKEMEK